MKFAKIISQYKAMTPFLFAALLALSACGAAPANSGAELTIAAFSDSQYLENTARKYEETHNGVNIIITSYAGEEKDVSKYSQIINTALMSGKGEDIIDVSGISWTKLADKVKLLDLTDEIRITPDEYYTSVMDAFLYNGKRYAIPLGFAFEAFQFDDAFADKENTSDLTLSRLLSLADKYPDIVLFNDSGLGMGRMSLAYKLFSMDFEDYVDVGNKKVYVDGAKFISLLKNVESMRDRLAVQKSGDISLIRQYALYSPAMCSMGTIDYSNMFLMTNDEGESNYLQGGFKPAVNANTASSNKKLAVDFIKFLISEEMQSSPELPSCPVNKSAAADTAKYILADSLTGGYVPDSWGEGSLEYLERNIAIFDELAGKLAFVEFEDDFIREFVMDEMARYFQGEASAEEAAQSLQSKLEIYLNE